VINEKRESVGFGPQAMWMLTVDILTDPGH